MKSTTETMSERVTRAAQAVVDRNSEPTGQIEVHTPDGDVYRGRDERDVSANLQLQDALRRRTTRGRDPMRAHLLGFFYDGRVTP